MWRQNTFPGNSDSDQSISDEENAEADLGGNCISLAGNAQKEEKLQLQSRLEMLRSRNEWSPKGMSLNGEDSAGIKIPRFPNKVAFVFPQHKESFGNSDEEAISDDEDGYAVFKTSVSCSTKPVHKGNDHDGFGSGKQGGAQTWSMVSREAEALIRLNENTVSSTSAHSKASSSVKGVRGKVKPKFSFHLQLRKDRVSKNEGLVSSKVDMPEQLEIFDHGTFDGSNAELLKDFLESEESLEVVPAEQEACGDLFTGNSMAALLDGLQDKNIVLGGNYKMSRRVRGKKVQLVGKRSMYSLGDRSINNEEQPEPLASRSSSDEEASYQNQKPAKMESKRQTMVDRFQEALASCSQSNEGALVTVPRPLGFIASMGLFGKLQQVLESEKERDTHFLKKLQLGASPNDDQSSIVVKILSRYLDGKLIVCQCSIGKNIEASCWSESSQKLVNTASKRTVIFSPRVCGDVDLEVGSSIQIHHPWKEIQVMGDNETIILSTYFSQIVE